MQHNNILQLQKNLLITYHVLVQFHVLDRLSGVELTHAQIQVQIDKIWPLRHFVAHLDDAFVLVSVL